jgi:hypothetical protein
MRTMGELRRDKGTGGKPIWIASQRRWRARYVDASGKRHQVTSNVPGPKGARECARRRDAALDLVRQGMDVGEATERLDADDAGRGRRRARGADDEGSAMSTSRTIGVPIGVPGQPGRSKTSVNQGGWYRIPESRRASDGLRLNTVVTVGSGQLRWIPTGLRVRMGVQAPLANCRRSSLRRSRRA